MKPDDYLDEISQKAVKELANELGSRLKRDIGDEVQASLGQFLEAMEESPAKNLREACVKQDQVLELLNGRLHSSESAKAELGQELEKLKEKVNTTLMEKAEAEARKEKALEEKAKAEGLRQSLFDEKTEAEEALARGRARLAKESDELRARIQSIQNDLAETTELAETRSREKAESEARAEKALREKAHVEKLRQSLFDEKTEAEEALARGRARSAKESDELRVRIQSIQNDLAETTELAETRSKEKAESEKELQETNRINQALKARVKSYAVSRAVAIILMSLSLAVAGYTTFTGQGYPDRKRGVDRRVEELNAMFEKKDQVIGELSREQNRLTSRAENLNKQLRRQTGRPAPPSESKVVTYRTSTVVYFTLGSIGLSEQGAAKVRLLAEKIKTIHGVLIRVEGHSDNKPLGRTSKVKHNDNKGLSKSRASVVARLLIEAGVDASRISIVGFGTNRPIVPNDSPENRDKNRRVEIKVASNGG